jgi:hypothetical protein
MIFEQPSIPLMGAVNCIPPGSVGSDAMSHSGKSNV